ncbi:Conserved hypothetical membrane protein [Ogataea parapolymorpha DL-1]|uniref:Conserved hypothetical membrane protein n=1 Tax=Ogataea parapolymorpha (strain ATCC 26012 / BCRC 20466 / JCM 22074 / NRRL Y-7560 / DL-1) TaxID=871575 RepID=W1QJP9_OGAPD|nr:Conserved hypothetical membrane protein [Ogataea parapolymorpha DL-1]ESX02857.1 Conserved hypothetical membrane protein [Ogataea parapolymorpha DL-1]
MTTEVELETQNSRHSEEGLLEASDPDEVYYENNKKRSWLVVLGSFFGLLPVWGLANSIGVIQTQLLEYELSGVSTTTVSWIFSIYTALLQICMIFSGTYFDRHGTRLPLIVGTFMMTGSLLGFANSTKVYQSILSFSGVGIASGILSSPLMGAVSQYFPARKRATAMALAGNGGCVGGLIIPTMLRKTYVSLGFAWSMRLLALITFVCLLISIFLVKERRVVEAEEMSRKDTVIFYLTKSFNFKALRDDRKFLFCVLGCVFAEGTVLVTSSLFSFVCIKNGFSSSQAYLFVTVINIGAVVGRLLSGLLADVLFGSYNIIIFLLVITAVFNFVVWMPFKSSTGAMYTYSILYGTFYGGIYSLIPTCCSMIVKKEEFGANYATMYAITGLSLLGLNPAAAAIVGNGTSNKRTNGFIAYASALSLLGAVCISLTRVLCVGAKLKKF